MLDKNKILAIFIYFNKKNIIERNEFKKLIYSSGFIIGKLLDINIRYPNKKYFFGLGKLKEIILIINKFYFKKILINLILKSTQEYNLKKIFKCSILNRTSIILNIFKKRANTNYGKLQVELAYLNYLSTRLVRRWRHLERQKGGIKYISGPGEKQIEIDRRIIKKKITSISNSIQKISGQKKQNIKFRNKYNVPIVSLVGYTNSGKSTLFNLLTNSDFNLKKGYFSTLDTYIRKINKFKFHSNVLLSDTIGFIRNLPDSIKSAFKSTLSEISYSQLILHIIDASNLYFMDYINIVNSILCDINIHNVPVIQVMNKIDKLKNFKIKIDINNINLPIRIWISAKYNLGIETIYNIINLYLFTNKIKMTICIPLKISILLRDIFYSKNIVLKEWSNNGKIYYYNILVTKIVFLSILKKYPVLKKYLK